MLGSLMEDKRLDFDAPLLSVRRFSGGGAAAAPPTAAESAAAAVSNGARRSPLPTYISELKSGPVRNPGVVPFVWEQRPGQPKDGPGAGAAAARPLAAPRPPPAKLGSSVRTRRHPPSTPPTPPPDGEGTPPSPEPAESGAHKVFGEMTDQQPPPPPPPEQPRIEANNRTLHDDSKKDGGGGGGGGDGGDDDDDDDEDDDDVFSDARDTLSRTESFMNCSLSGLSGMPQSSSDPPHNGFAKDPLARDFMMGRFLSAAQAVASGSPQYAFRKVANPKQPERIVTGDHRRRLPVPLPYQHTPYYNTNLQYSWPPLPPGGEGSYENDEEEEEDDDYDALRRFPSSGCGFLPKFCLKSSLCLLNPIPVMKVRDRPPPPPHARRNARPLIRSLHNATLGQAGDEHSWEAVYKHKLGQKYQSQGEDGKSKLTNDSNQLTYWSDSQTADGSSPFRRSTGDGSPLRNEARESPFHEGKGLLGVPNRDWKSSKGDCSDLVEKDGEDCWDTMPHNSSQQGSGSGSGLMSPAAEKGVDVDAVDVPDADPKVRIESGEKDFEIEEVSRNIKESYIIEAHNRNARGLVSTLAVSDPGERNGSETFKGNKISDGTLQSKGEDLVKKDFKPVRSVLPLPLPKSPSESWLSRTLPSVSSKKPPAQSVFGIQVQQKKQALRAMTNQQEANARPPKPQHRQTRFAEVLAKPTSPNSEF